MIGLDTNVVVRYLVRDDPAQFAVAEARIDAAAEAREALFISAIVVAELVWVLESVYGHDRGTVGDILDRLLGIANVVIENSDQVRLALEHYRHDRGDLADYLLGAINAAHGCERTLTFDRALDGNDLFEAL